MLTLHNAIFLEIALTLIALYGMSRRDWWLVNISIIALFVNAINIILKIL